MTYWFEIVGEDSDLCGEEFLVEFPNGTTKVEAIEYVKYRLFPNEKVKCYGKVSDEEAEMMGLDTY